MQTNLLKDSIKDLLTPTMLKYSLMPFILSVIILYILFFVLAGTGMEHFATLDIQTSQTTIEDGIPHTENFSATLQDSAIIKFLMSSAITSWFASFLVYSLGGFLVVYASIFIAIIVIGFLTPKILRYIQKKHYHDVEMIGYSNSIEAIFLTFKSIFIMMILFILLFPFYFIPLINVIAFNIPLYYFFHKMLTYDISSQITTREEVKQINFYSGNKIRLKTIMLYMLSLIPFVVFFISIFFVIYLGHTYLYEVKKLRESN